MAGTEHLSTAVDAEAQVEIRQSLAKERLQNNDHEKVPVGKEGDGGDVNVARVGDPPPAYLNASLAEGESLPTEEERVTLRKVSDKIPLSAYFVVGVEFAERFAYYGMIGPFQNYIQNPLPAGSTTGRAMTASDVPGAIGRGQQAATGLTTFFSFFCYVTPFLGAILADTRWGRFKAICVFTSVYIAGLLIILLTSIPPSLLHNGAFPGLIVGMIIMGLGTGGIKSNVAPLIADQLTRQVQVVRTTDKGERVIVDPSATVGRVFLYFYFFINLGSLSSIATTESERHVGFWLSFLLPTAVFILVPTLLVLGRNKYVKLPPRGSVILEAAKVCRLVLASAWSWNPVTLYKTITQKIDGSLWDRAKPTYIAVHGGPTKKTKEVVMDAEGRNKPSWLTWDDTFVDEVKRTFSACKVFAFYPIYWLAYNQMTNNLISQAGVMDLRGVPNDLIQNFDAITLIVFIPIVDRVVYPFFRRIHRPFRPIARITFGFFFASLSMVYAAVLQYKIYQQSPCMRNGLGTNDNPCDPVGINVWIQIPAYVLIAFSEIFASITGLEYAYLKAPARMKSLVMAIFLFMTALANAIGEALVSVSADPYLVGMYSGIAIAAFVAGAIFYISFRHLDKNEESDNEIGRSGNRHVDNDDEE